MCPLPTADSIYKPVADVLWAGVQSGSEFCQGFADGAFKGSGRIAGMTGVSVVASTQTRASAPCPADAGRAMLRDAPAVDPPTEAVVGGAPTIVQA